MIFKQIALALLFAGCADTPEMAAAREADFIYYVHDARTGMCFAHGRHIGEFVQVECSTAVLAEARR